MHSSRLSDPLDDAARAMKKVSAKRQKTDDDHAELGRLEHAGSLYLNQDGPYLPADNVLRMLSDAAKKHKLGVKVKEGVLVTEDATLLYDGPRSADGLWKDQNYVSRASVKVGTSRVIRTRPQFRQWAAAIDGWYDPAIIDFRELETIVETGGARIGLGDWRPRFGRFIGRLERVA
jgi:hypothetical protein